MVRINNGDLSWDNAVKWILKNAEKDNIHKIYVPIYIYTESTLVHNISHTQIKNITHTHKNNSKSVHNPNFNCPKSKCTHTKQ